MKFLKYVTQTTFTDVAELPAGITSAVWTYKGIYVVDDTEVGIASAAVSVTVGKKV